LLPPLLNDWFAFMWSPSHPFSLRLALGVPQFLRIHPFAAANGKTVRAYLLKHGQATGELDPVAAALALMLQGRREELLRLWSELYRGRVQDYLVAISCLSAWISRAHHQEQSESSGSQPRIGAADHAADELIARFFAFADAIAKKEGH
jgi:hypothetical protein